MKIKPVGKKVLLRVEESNIKKLNGTVDFIIKSEGKKVQKFYIEEVGADVRDEFKKGQQVIPFSNAHLNGCTDDITLCLVDQNDIWGILDK